MFSGVHDENDRSYRPNIVRIGLKAHHSIKSVALDELVCREEDLNVFKIALRPKLLFSLPYH